MGPSMASRVKSLKIRPPLWSAGRPTCASGSVSTGQGAVCGMALAFCLSNSSGSNEASVAVGRPGSVSAASFAVGAILGRTFCRLAIYLSPLV